MRRAVLVRAFIGLGWRPLESLARLARNWRAPGAVGGRRGIDFGYTAGDCAAGSGARMPKRAAMWMQDDSGRVHTPFEPVVLVATLSLIPVLIIEADTTSEGWLTFAEVANWVIWAIFATELAAVLIVAKRRRAALRAHWLDVAIVVLTIPLLGKALAWIRFARFVRLARFGVIVGRALQAERRRSP